MFTDTFELTPDAEVAIEVDPRVTTPEQIALLADLGWNRISMGVQDFDEKVQKAVKRVQPEAMTRAVARVAGLFMVVYYPALSYAGFYLSESPFMVLVTASALVALILRAWVLNTVSS